MVRTTTRKFDALGRLVIPAKICHELQFEKSQKVEITIEYGKICIKKYKQRDIQKVPYLGIIRALDSLNRVVIPSEYVRVCKIEKGDNLKISMLGEKIEISKN